MKYWIFQGNPTRFDVADRSRVDEGKRETWLVSRYRDLMHAGDIVYFWRSGETNRRGIYAWGTMQAEPEYHENWGSGVNILYKKRLPEHIPASTMQSNEVLRENLIFRMAIGTNFALSNSEAAAIEEIIRLRFGMDYTPGVH